MICEFAFYGILRNLLSLPGLTPVRLWRRVIQTLASLYSFCVIGLPLPPEADPPWAEKDCENDSLRGAFGERALHFVEQVARGALMSPGLYKFLVIFVGHKRIYLGSIFDL